ncbi:MAG TPA: GLPGLI family protein [Flavisolibacter sp.]|nr:GLPGLI family protein [Flavisolibacter sp.]
MKKLILTIPIIIFLVHNQANAQFISTVKIEFEKTINVPALYKEMDPDWYDMIKDNLPKSDVSYYDFTGDNTHSLYKPGRENPTNYKMGYRPIADKNVVFTDYNKGMSISQKPVWEETFLVEDSLQKIKWKITPDTRTIAGFECRKAVGILDDSIAVFAFYTDEIMITGGPESIHGLPGMILGVGIPRLHTTWFATKVEISNINMNKVVPETKGKKVNRATMMNSLDKVLRQWGTYGGKLIVNFAI